MLNLRVTKVWKKNERFHKFERSEKFISICLVVKIVFPAFFST